MYERLSFLSAYVARCAFITGLENCIDVLNFVNWIFKKCPNAFQFLKCIYIFRMASKMGSALQGVWKPYWCTPLYSRPREAWALPRVKPFGFGFCVDFSFHLWWLWQPRFKITVDILEENTNSHTYFLQRVNILVIKCGKLLYTLNIHDSGLKSCS